MQSRTYRSRSFQSTAPVWGPTLASACSSTYPQISIHGPRVGADVVIRIMELGDTNISIHGPRVGADRVDRVYCNGWDISIHGPRVGADLVFGFVNVNRVISIHGPRVGADVARSIKQPSI